MLILVPTQEEESQGKTWDAKRMLVKKRLEGLAHIVKNEEYENADVPVTHYEAKTNTSSSPHSCVGVVSTSAMERALKLQGNLSLQFPNCSKLMMRSHVCGRFWMCLPKSFCDVHLPKHDATVVLVDDKENEYKMKYVLNRYGITDGWQRFALAQKLMEGDVIVFQLVQPCKFKVWIVRASGLSEVDREIGLANLDFHDKPTNAGINEMKKQDFKISVDGLTLDSKLATHLRNKYYELCRSQNTFLHENLTYGLNIKLATGIISETVNIADAIRAVKTTTSLNDLESWDRTLKAFEDLGMAVGFLRARIHELLSLSVEYQEIIESKRSEKAEAEHEMSRVKEKLLEVETLIRSLNEEIDTLKVKSEGLNFAIRDAASAPW